MTTSRCTEGTKRRASIYLRAAERIARGKNTYSCCAIGRQSDYEEPLSKHIGPYVAVFKPERAGTFWGSGWDIDEVDTHDAVPRTAEGKACRILALCFMAAMVEAGDA